MIIAHIIYDTHSPHMFPDRPDPSLLVHRHRSSSPPNPYKRFLVRKHEITMVQTTPKHAQARIASLRQKA